jgi:putative flippase GtrA
LIIAQALVEINTHTSAQIIHFFAFLTCSSAHPEVRYIIPAIIRARTDTTATYLIHSAIVFQRKVKKVFKPQK